MGRWELVTAVYKDNEIQLYANDEYRKSTHTSIEQEAFSVLRIEDAFGQSRNYN